MKGFGLVFSDFGEGLRKQGFAQDWMLSGNGVHSVIGYFNKSYLEEEKTIQTRCQQGASPFP